MKKPAALLFLMILTTAHFSAEALDAPAGWRWDRPVEGHAKSEQGTLMLRTEKGRVWAGGGSQNRLQAVAPVGKHAEAFIDVELVDARGKWEQCGLLLHLDDDNFVKLVVEHIDGDHFVVAGFEFDQKRKVLAKIKIDGARAKLKLSVSERKVSAYYLADGAWKNIAELTWTPDAARHFMVFSQDGAVEPARWAKIHDLRLR